MVIKAKLGTVSCHRLAQSEQKVIVDLQKEEPLQLLEIDSIHFRMYARNHNDVQRTSCKTKARSSKTISTATSKKVRLTLRHGLVSDTFYGAWSIYKMAMSEKAVTKAF